MLVPITLQGMARTQEQLFVSEFHEINPSQNIPIIIPQDTLLRANKYLQNFNLTELCPANDCSR